MLWQDVVYLTGSLIYLSWRALQLYQSRPSSRRIKREIRDEFADL